MPNSLENQFIADTFKALLHTGNISLSGGSPEAKLYSGDGFESSLTVSTISNGIKISGDATIYGNVISSKTGNFSGSLSSGSHTVTGNSNISGTLSSGSHTVTGNSNISGTSRIGGTTTIIGSLSSGSHTVTGNSRITNRIDTNTIYADTYLNLPVTDTKADLVNHIYPVGSIFLSFTNANPSFRFTGTSWVQISQGRFIVGAGTGNDGPQNRAFTTGNTTGEYEHQLTIAEMPSHNHGGVMRYPNIGGSLTEQNQKGVPEDYASFNQNTTSTGGDQYHQNTPPGFGLYVWQRTS
jgi:microcystin-dependent protein